MTTKTKKTSNPSTPPKRTPAKGRRRSGKTAKAAAEALARGDGLAKGAQPAAQPRGQETMKDLTPPAPPPQYEARLRVVFLDELNQTPDLVPNVARVGHREDGSTLLLDANGGEMRVYPPRTVRFCDRVAVPKQPTNQPQVTGY